MRKYVLGSFLALALASTSVAQESQQPPQTNPAEDEAPASNDQRGTEGAPLVVKVLPAENEAEVAKRDEEERTAKAESDGKLIEFTGQLAESTVDLAEFTKWLAIGTAVLGFATLGLLFFAGKQSRDTRRAIDLAVDEFRATHRPAIKVLNLESMTQLADGDLTIEARTTFVNAGPTTAKNLKVRAKITRLNDLAPGVPLPEIEAAFKDLDGGVSDTVAVGSKMSRDMQREAEGQARINSQTSPKVYCLGVISYEDIAGRRRETGFCRYYDPEQNHWKRAEESEYEYAY
jgi:hypothetical protein